LNLHQKIVARILHPLDAWRVGESARLSYLRELEHTQFLPTEQVRALQLERLRTLLAHAYQNCSFYRARLDECAVGPGDIQSLQDVTAIPPLDKTDIQAHRDSMVASNWPPEDLIPNQTGGSTGTPISFFLSRDRKCSRTAMAFRHNRWAGWEIGDKVAYVWGAPTDIPESSLKRRLRNVLMDRSLYLNAGHITETKLREFHADLLKFRPKIIQGYARTLALLARFVRSNTLSQFQPQAIVTSAEVLTQSDREIIEEVFGCRVFNRYGSREVSVVASECSKHDGMHIAAEGLYVEVVRRKNSLQAGEVGSILVTDLLNFAMPLVRYRIGDMGSLDATPCPCGRGLPRLQSVEGRVTDFLVGTDGRLVSGVFLATYVLAQCPGLGTVQAWQERPDRVLYRVTARPEQAGIKQDLDFLQSETKRHLGSDITVDFEFVDELAPSASGKFLFCRSTAACDFMDLGN
jgi:phenylacetate-CoA ligase